MSLKVKNLFYTYFPGTSFESVALANVTLDIACGEYIGIMGHTGCGKSTLIQLLAGLLSPTAGEIFLNGKDINETNYDRKELRRKVGILFQYPECQLFETTVEKDVAFGLKHGNLDRESVDANVRYAIEAVGFNFEQIRKQSPLSLSGGEKRRVAIAGVLATRPEILILDEPIAGLDPYGRKMFLELTESLNEEGTTIVMVSHNINALAEHAKRIIVMEKGVISRDGAARKVFSNIEEFSEKGIGMSQVMHIKKLLLEQGQVVPKDVTRYSELLPYLQMIGKRGRI